MHIIIAQRLLGYGFVVHNMDGLLGAVIEVKARDSATIASSRAAAFVDGRRGFTDGGGAVIGVAIGGVGRSVGSPSGRTCSRGKMIAEAGRGDRMSGHIDGIDD